MIEIIAYVVRKDTQEPTAEVTPTEVGHAFLPGEDGDSKPVGVERREVALWFEDQDRFEVEWLDEPEQWSP